MHDDVGYDGIPCLQNNKIKNKKRNPTDRRYLQDIS